MEKVLHSTVLIAFLVVLAGSQRVSDWCDRPHFRLNRFELDVTNEEEMLLLIEARCFMACISEGQPFHVS